jgi:acyl dehydratase
MAGLRFEESHQRQMFEHPLTRTVTDMGNARFSLLTMKPQPLHVDAHPALGLERRQRLSNSIRTLGVMIGMSVADTTLGTTMGDLGMTGAPFPKPVFHGDTPRARTKAASKRKSRSRPGARLVPFEHECLNQRGVAVATCRRTGPTRERPMAA